MFNKDLEEINRQSAINNTKTEKKITVVVKNLSTSAGDMRDEDLISE